MDRPMSVWDFSTPSMGLQEIGLPGLCEPENTDVQEALCVFNMPTMPTLFDHDGGTVADADATEQHHDITRQDSPRQRVRRSASMEQKQASNREHQRRFRERSKARSQAIEAQLARTVSELRDLKSRHQQLELMLEQAHQSSQDQLSHSSSETEGDMITQHKSRLNDIDLSPLLSISIQGRRSSLTADEVRSMPTQQFSALWTAYVHELGQCLLKLDEDEHGIIARRLLLLSVEGMRLVGRRLLQNPAAHKALITANLVQGQPTLLHLDSDFYINLLGLLELSDEQVADLMHLRKLYLMKRGQLALQRKALVTSLACCDDQLVHPSDNSATAVEVAARLKDIAFEDQAVLYRIARTVWVGIMSSKQLSLVMVHAYPYMPILEPMLDTLAMKEGYPSHEEVVACAKDSPMTAAWRDFDAYAMFIHRNMFSEERAVYVPLSRHVASPMQGKLCRTEVNSARRYIMT